MLVFGTSLIETLHLCDVVIICTGTPSLSLETLRLPPIGIVRCEVEWKTLDMEPKQLQMIRMNGIKP